MNVQRTLTDYLNSLGKARVERKRADDALASAKRDYDKAFQPLLSEPTRETLEALYAMCSDKHGFNRSDYFICIALLLYSPESLFGGRMQVALARDISEVLGFGHNAIFMARKRVAFWLNTYDSFYSEVCRLYAEVMTNKNVS